MASSPTVPETSTAVSTGVSLAPKIVTTTSRVVVASGRPESSVRRRRQVAVTDSPAPRNCTSALSSATAQPVLPLAAALATPAPLSVSALASAVCSALKAALFRSTPAEALTATGSRVTSTRSLRSVSAQVRAPLSLKAAGAPEVWSSVTLPVRSPLTTTGASLAPWIVTVRAWVAVASALPESSVRRNCQVAVTDSPSPSDCVSALSSAKAQVIVPAAAGVAAPPSVSAPASAWARAASMTMPSAALAPSSTISTLTRSPRSTSANPTLPLARSRAGVPEV